MQVALRFTAANDLAAVVAAALGPNERTKEQGFDNVSYFILSHRVSHRGDSPKRSAPCTNRARYESCSKPVLPAPHLKGYVMKNDRV